MLFVCLFATNARESHTGAMLCLPFLRCQEKLPLPARNAHDVTWGWETSAGTGWVRILLLFYTQESGSYTRDLSPLVSGWEGARFPQIPERALPFRSRLSVEILWGLGNIPRHRSFRDDICSLFHLCCTKDEFSTASIGGFRNELFLKNLSLSFEKTLRASPPFRELRKEC